MRTPTPTPPADPDDLGLYVQKVLITLAIVALALVAFRWLHVLLLAFGAMLMAVFLRALANPIRQRTPLDARWSLAAAVLLVIAIVAAVVWFVGAQVSAQLFQLENALPTAWDQVQRQLGQFQGGRWLLAWLQEARSGGRMMSDLGPIAGRIGRWTTSGIGALTDLVVVIVAGVYFAAQPTLYRDGLVRLAPSRARPAVAETIDDIAVALRRWLVGTGVAMVAMGVLTTIGTAALGLPAPLALGLLSGVAEFVPIVGAILSAIPGLLLAATHGADTVLWTLLFYIGAHQFEGHVLIPLIQRRVVSVPPALTLLSVIAFGILFGPLGVIFATPLAVVVLVIVKRLYLHDPLDAATTAEGQPTAPGPIRRARARAREGE